MKYRRAMAVCLVVLFALTAPLAAAADGGAEEFLDDDTAVFLTLRDLGKLGDDLAASEFSAKLNALPLTRLCLRQLKRQLAGNPLYQAVVQNEDAAALIRQMYREDITLAVPKSSVAEVTALLVNLGRLGELDDEAAMMPEDAPAEQRAAFESKALDAWKTLLSCEIPSFVLAARMDDPETMAQLERLVKLFDAGPGEEGLMIVTTPDDHNGTPVMHVSAGLNEAALAEMEADLADEANRAPGFAVDPAEKLAVARELVGILRDRRVELSYGVSGGYCIVSVGDGGKALADMLDRQAGRAGGSLGRSERFGPVAGMMTGEVLGAYCVNTDGWADIYREHVSPLLEMIVETTLEDGFPAEEVERRKEAHRLMEEYRIGWLELFSNAGGVCVRDQGLLLRNFARFDPEAARKLDKTMRSSQLGYASFADLENKPSRMLDVIPADVLAYAIKTNSQPDVVWSTLINNIEQQRASLEAEPLGPENLELFGRCDEIIRRDILPKLGSETGMVVAPGGSLSLDFGRILKLFGREGGAALGGVAPFIDGMPMPGMALAIEVRQPDGLYDSMRRLFEMAKEDLENRSEAVQQTDPAGGPAGDGPPNETTEREHRGVKILSYPLGLGDGFEPSFAIIKNFLVVSSSPEMLRGMIGVSLGEPSSGANPRFMSIPDVYKDRSTAMTFIDIVGCTGWAEKLGVFGFTSAERHFKEMGMPAEGEERARMLNMLKELAMSKFLVFYATDCLQAFKCAGSCSWVSGDTLHTRARLRIEDLPPPPAAPPVEP